MYAALKTMYGNLFISIFNLVPSNLVATTENGGWVLPQSGTCTKKNFINASSAKKNCIKLPYSTLHENVTTVFFGTTASDNVPTFRTC